MERFTAINPPKGYTGSHRAGCTCTSKSERVLLGKADGCEHYSGARAQSTRLPSSTLHNIADRIIPIMFNVGLLAWVLIAYSIG